VSVKVHLFVMRASFSGAAFCQASLVETQQAFLELHVQAFEWFGGVFAEIRFDNLKSAVKKVLKGRRRVETDRFIALRSHYLFASQFTTPGLDGAHEKGGVEGEVGRYRRNHLVPVPELRDLAELNALLLAGCEQDLGRRIDGRSVTVGEAWAVERPLLRDLPAEAFDACETAAPRVDSKALVTIRQNRYSVPVALAGLKVSARIGAREITINHAGREVARHERMHSKFGTSVQLDHYLELLQRKPGGLEHSVALAQERDRGAWPECFDELWAGLTDRYGRSDAARQMVDVLLLCRDHGPARVELATRGALAAGAIDGRAVAVLARRAQTSGRAVPALLADLDPRLQAHQRPAPDLTDYDQLLGGIR
ncbi:MAG: Mu transposase domain-containing protein, partial [Solirubrobacteraceae bacterium]